MLDIASEFYLETARAMFIDHDLARGRMCWHRRTVDPGGIHSALLMIEGANHEIFPGRTRAAHDLCTGIPANRKRDHLAAGVGHYGLVQG